MKEKNQPFDFNELYKEITIRCDCGCGERLVVTKCVDDEYNHEHYDVTFQTDCSHEGLTLFKRIKIAFKFIRGYTAELSGVILNRNDIKKLSKDLLELLDK